MILKPRNPMPSIDSWVVCAKILQEEKRYNIEHNILPTKNAIVDHLLDRHIELREACKELYDKLHKHPNALEIFLDTLLSIAAFWSPKKIAKARSERERLGVVNIKIASVAAELAHLLDQRRDLHNHSSFHSDTHYDVCGVIEAAASDNYLFNS
jgi:hypothetical protein